MIIASCRRDGWSGVDFSEKLGFVGWDDPDLPERGTHGLVIVHGYRNGKEAVETAYAAIEERMAAKGVAYDWIAGFAWPGGLTVLGYPFASLRTAKSAAWLATFCTMLNRLGVTYDLNAHSLGARVALGAAGMMYRQGEHYGLERLWLLGAAVDDEVLTRDHGILADAVPAARKTLVLYTAHDRVLSRFYRLWSWPPFAETALGLKGPERQRSGVLPIDCTQFVGGHSEYRRTEAVYELYRREVEG